MAPVCQTEDETVIVVDNEPDLRKHLVELITSLGYQAQGFGSSTELHEHAAHVNSGCIILNLMLPGLDGLAIHESLSKSGIILPVILISGSDNIDAVVEGMKGGAIDCLPKPIPEMALRRAVSAGVAKSRMLNCHRQSQYVVRSLMGSLTPTELRVARLIAKGYPTKLIASDLGRSENTIKIHRHRIFTKLKVNSSASVANLMSHANNA